MRSLVCLLVSLCCFQFYSPTDAQQCLLATNGDRQLPAFIRPDDKKDPRFEHHPIQAIITSYQFNCCGEITEWRAFVEGSGNGHFDDQPYTISFQVWRPDSTSSSYTMIGINLFSRIPLADPDTADRGIVTGVPPESERIEVQPGDVVGFYLQSSKGKKDGIQFAADRDNDSPYNEETVWFVTDTDSIISPVPATLSVGPSGLLSVSTNLAPLISVVVTNMGCPSSTPVVTSSITPTSSTRSITPIVPTSTPAPGNPVLPTSSNGGGGGGIPSPSPSESPVVTSSPTDNVSTVGAHNIQSTSGPPNIQSTSGPPNIQSTSGTPNIQSTMTSGPRNIQSTSGPPNIQSTSGVPNIQSISGARNIQSTSGPPNIQLTVGPPVTPLTTNIPTTQTTAESTAQSVVTPGQQSVAGPVAGVLVVLLLLIITALVVIVAVLWSRQRGGYSTKKAPGSHIDNMVYDNIAANAKPEPVLIAMDNINYVDPDDGVVLNCDYDDIEESRVTDATYAMLEDTSAPLPPVTTDYATLESPGHISSAPLPPVTTDYESPTATLAYEVPVATLQKGVHPREWGLVVPSQEQRSKVVATNNNQDIYSSIRMSQYSSVGPAPKFFEECDIYWAPSSVANELYEQLAKQKYREILRPQIQITKFLGSGAFGTVSQGLWQSPGGGIEVAVKTNQSKNEEDKVKFLQEAAIMGQFRHPNVVNLMGVVTVGEPVMIVLELLSNGDLRNFLIKMQPEPGEMVPSNTPKLLLKFCQQICCGMEYLARKSFVHRDLAARNVLVSEDKECKISDFGMSRDLMDETYYMSQGGKIPVKWTAPEAIHYKKYSTASDVWSFGCVMYEIWSLGHKPFENHSNSKTIRMVDKGVRLPPPPGCPREVYKFMLECWHPETARRPSFAQLVEMHSQANFELLLWRDSDIETGPQVKVVGAPLEAAKNLYSDLQNVYIR